jgi:hypothetical protein
MEVNRRMSFYVKVWSASSAPVAVITSTSAITALSVDGRDAETMHTMKFSGDYVHGTAVHNEIVLTAPPTFRDRTLEECTKETLSTGQVSEWNPTLGIFAVIVIGGV